MKSTEYCPKCRRVTEQIKVLDEKLCKRCGKISKRINAKHLLIGHQRERENPIHEILESLRR